MIRSLGHSCLAMVALLALATPVLAESPHFIRSSTSPKGDTLVVSFKEAGLGTNQLVTIRVSATATATYVCVNKGGNVPSDPKKTTVTGLVSQEGSFSSGKNGSISGSLTLTPPPPPADFKCPAGQRIQLVAGSVSYSNVLITDVTNGVTTTP